VTGTVSGGRIGPDSLDDFLLSLDEVEMATVKGASDSKGRSLV